MAGRGLVVCESPSGTWHYHLREVPEGGPELGGARNGVALCGANIGWDTKINLGAWGMQSHVPEHWCSTCFEKALELVPGEVTRVEGGQDCSICGKEYYLHPDAYLLKDGHPFLTRLCDGRVVHL